MARNSKSKLLCSGEYSCANIKSITTTHDTSCTGPNACYKSGISKARDIYCSGYYGCAQATFIQASRNISCDGSHGCFEVEGDIQSTDGDIKC